MDMDRSFVCSYEPGKLRLSNHNNTEHFFGFCLQVFRKALPPHRVDCLASVENKRKVSFPSTQRQWIVDSIDCTDENSFSAEEIKLIWFDLRAIKDGR